MFGPVNDDKLALIADVPLFRGLSRRQLREVARLLDLSEVEAGRVLTREGDRGLEFFVIVDGIARVERDGRQVASLAPGDVLGEMSLLDDARRSATVTAQTAMRVLVGERRVFAPLLDSDADLRRVVLDAAAVREQQNAA